MTPANCSQCGTELPVAALACPACQALIHSETLKALAADADAATRAGDIETARMRWTATLALLPQTSQQHVAIRQRLDELARPGNAAARSEPIATDERPWWRRGAAGLVTVGVVFLSKIKFLLLGLTKASTFISMFAFFGVYWSIYGCRLRSDSSSRFTSTKWVT